MLARSQEFVRSLAIVELSLVVLVGVVCLMFGSRSLPEIGQGLLVAGFGVSLLGAASVMRSIRQSEPPTGQFRLPANVRSVDTAVCAAMNVSRESYNLFWLTTAAGAASFIAGAILIQAG